ncbi:MAG: hypothetical protein OXC10_10615 [Rhodospirillaceae bacterium]|nr:hypothetical protein [Rhodospirillaceae bacterium]
MIVLDDDGLEFHFPEVHEAARCRIDFQRTLRIPDDGGDYPLPPGLGSFPLRHLDDYAARLPDAWRRRGGVIMPMYQAEALWIAFDASYPFAVKVSAGKVCALTGDGWAERLNRDPQDYLVLPDQPWLDGFCVEKGIIRQFVAMPLGEGYTAEEQLTGAAEHGGLQIVAFPMKVERYEALLKDQLRMFEPLLHSCSFAEDGMGLAPGGRMKQDIYDDPYGLDAWDQRQASRCFVSIVNTVQWLAIAGERPPAEPPTAEAYSRYGLPWFDYYDADRQALAGSNKLKGLRSVAEHTAAQGKAPLPDNGTVDVPRVVDLGKPRGRRVREAAEEVPA